MSLSNSATPLVGRIFRRRSQFILGIAAILSLFANTAWAQSAAAEQPTELDLKLEALVTEFERQRVEMHIPGMALAVVKDDQLVMAKGFGSADVANNVPVTAETIFAIGSSSKAFTASLVGMLIDQGKMDWDDPVTKYLPYFELDIDTEDPNAVVTIRDLLAHRTGFTRMGLLWAGNHVPREEVLRAAVNAQAWSEFRGDFFYNNVTFMAAGVAAEKASGLSWEQQVEQRLFKPLGMEHSTTSVSASKQRPNLSLGYTWKEASQRHDQPPMRELDAIAPAGSINSNVLDMSEWVRFQLNRGKVDGVQLLSEERLGETWTQQIAIADTIGYGLGWMLYEVQGHRVVAHGGNIDGFSAEVALFPDDNLGFVLLTNLSAAPLQSAAVGIFADTMLSEPGVQTTEAEEQTQDSLDAYTGKYIANFGPFKDARFTVSAQDGVLAVDVPGQTNYELKAPDDEGKRYFVLTDQIAVSFERNQRDEVSGLTMYQGGLTFELPKEGVELIAEIPLDELQRYLGMYHLEERGRNFEVVIQNKRLAIDIPGQMVAELRPPDAEGRWVFRATDRVSAKFNEDENGNIVSLTMTEPDDTRTLPRLQDNEVKALPTVDAIFEKRPPVHTRKAVKISGISRHVHAGITGELTAYAEGKNQRVDVQFGKFGWTRTVVTADSGRSDSNISPTENFEGKYLLQAQLDNPTGWLGDIRQLFDSMEVVRTATVDDKEVVAIRAKAGELPPRTLYFDAQTGDLVKSEVQLLEPNLGIAVPTETTYSDFRVVDGQRIPFRATSSNPWAGETVIEISKVEFLSELEASLFE